MSTKVKRSSSGDVKFYESRMNNDVRKLSVASELKLKDESANAKKLQDNVKQIWKLSLLGNVKRMSDAQLKRPKFVQIESVCANKPKRNVSSSWRTVTVPILRLVWES